MKVPRFSWRGSAAAPSGKVHLLMSWNCASGQPPALLLAHPFQKCKNTHKIWHCTPQICILHNFKNILDVNKKHAFVHWAKWWCHRLLVSVVEISVPHAHSGSALSIPTAASQQSAPITIPRGHGADALDAFSSHCTCLRRRPNGSGLHRGLAGSTPDSRIKIVAITWMIGFLQGFFCFYLLLLSLHL